MTRNFAKALNYELEFVPAVGTAGGLLTMWKPGSITQHQVIKGDRFLLLLVHLNHNNQSCIIGNVYGPNTKGERAIFFDELGLALSNWTGCCILGGDFNATLNLEDRSGGLGGAEPSFNNFVNDWNFIDLPLQNLNFTWFSSRNGGVWSRIDGWLLNDEAWTNFEETIQRVENWGLSDHRGVVLSMGIHNSGPKPFLFYNDWLLDKEFQGLVNEWWNSSVVHGWSDFVLQQKFKDLKEKIRAWRGHSGSRLEARVKTLEAELQEVMGMLELEGASEELLSQRRAVLSGLWDGYKAEESKWQQKARVKWLQSGDKNTAFFHRVSKIRRAKNHIYKIKANGQEMTEADQVKSAIRDHFMAFFRK